MAHNTRDIINVITDSHLHAASIHTTAVCNPVAGASAEIHKTLREFVVSQREG